MNRNKKLLTTVFVLALGLGIWALAVVDFADVASSFAKGEVVSAESFNDLFEAINSNFGAAKTAIEQNEADIGTLQTFDATLSSTSCEADEAMQTVGEGGTVTCATLSAGGGLTLPFEGDANSNDTAFAVSNIGSGGAASFSVNDADNLMPALSVTNNNINASTLLVSNSAGGSAGFFVGGVTLTDGGLNVVRNTADDGNALSAVTNGTGRAGQFSVNNASSQAEALFATSNTGTLAQATLRSLATGRGTAGEFEVDSITSPAPALYATTNGSGVAVYGNTSGSGTAITAEAATGGSALALRAINNGGNDNIAEFQFAGTNVARIDNSGKGFFNGGTQNSGADIAEAFEVEGSMSLYEPGDVMAISTTEDRRVTLTGEAYSTRVIGVYATKPGVLLTERNVDVNLSDTIPVGVMGVIPTKVTAENGAIRRGDILVASATPGHAMRADPENIVFGSIIGKALEPFGSEGTGLIEVMVNVK